MHKKIFERIFSVVGIAIAIVRRKEDDVSDCYGLLNIIEKYAHASLDGAEQIKILASADVVGQKRLGCQDASHTVDDERVFIGLQTAGIEFLNLVRKGVIGKLHSSSQKIETIKNSKKVHLYRKIVN